jgi:hypothetical protein
MFLATVNKTAERTRSESLLFEQSGTQIPLRPRRSASSLFCPLKPDHESSDDLFDWWIAGPGALLVPMGVL